VLLTNFIVQLWYRTFLENLTTLVVKKFPTVMKPECSSPCLQKSVIGHYVETVESTSLHPVYLSSIYVQKTGKYFGILLCMMKYEPLQSDVQFLGQQTVSESLGYSSQSRDHQGRALDSLKHCEARSVLLRAPKHSSHRTWHLSVAWDNPAITVASLCCLRFYYLILNFGRFSFNAEGVNSKQSERPVRFLFCFRITCLLSVLFMCVYCGFRIPLFSLRS
jgi:hypothetical protein